jgi:hypothetical protein
VKKFMLHDCTKGKCSNNASNKCKYGYPFKPDKYLSVNELKRIKNNPNFYNYQRFSNDDAYVIPYNLTLLLLWHGHINCLKLKTNGWISYLSKYISKPEPTSKNQLFDRINEVERYFTTRIVTSMEVADRLLDHALCKSSISVKHIQSNLSNIRSLLKTTFDLERMEENSTNVFYDNSIDVYLKRPIELLNIKYRDFFANYVRDHKHTTANEFKFRKLKKPIIIRVNFYNKLSDEESEAYYSQIILCNILLTNNNFDENNKYIFNNQNASYTFKEECNLLGLKDEDSPSYNFANTFWKTDANENLSEENGEFNEYLPAEERCKTVILNVDTTNESLNNEPVLISPIIDDNQLVNIDVNDDTYLQNNDFDEDSIVMEEMKLYYLNHFHESLKLFTSSQSFCYNYITNKLVVENVPAQLIIHGAAGTGKSYLIDSLRGYLIDKNINHAVIAYSGSAASLICGHTIHSFFNITADEHMTFKIQANSDTWNKIKEIEVFLVDEFTMLENVILNGINNILNVMHPSSNKRIFGGKSFILTGDIAQTTAIDTNIFENSIFTNKLEVLTLRECMRQLITAGPVEISNDHGMTESQLEEYIIYTKECEENQQRKFYTALNNIRTNNVTIEDEELLYSAVINTQFSLDNITDINKVTILTSLKHQRLLYNEMCLNKLNTNIPITEFVAVDSGDTKLLKLPTNYDNQHSKNHITKKACNLPDTLRLKLNCKVILLKNYNVLRGWVNGAFCTVVRIDKDKILLKKYLKPRSTRRSHLYKWIKPIRVRIKTSSKKIIYRTQFPIELGYAITIHKSQGHTLEELFVDLTSTFAHGQAYVAISRVKRLKNLHFIGWDRRIFKLQNEKLIQVMNSLNTRSIN